MLNVSASNNKTLCLTIGDSTGIGPEITVKFLAGLAAQSRILAPEAFNLLILGDIPQLLETADTLKIPLPQGSCFQYKNLQASGLNSSHKSPGAIAFESLEVAVSEINQGLAHGLVTGPISKEQLSAAHLPFTGHTEILQHLARKTDGKLHQSDMLFIYKNFRMLLLTRHVALRKVSETLSIKGVTRSLENLADFFKTYCQMNTPRLCVLGVNPHAGETDGDEEERVLKPALKLVTQQYGFGIEPPVAADAAFRHFDVDRLAYDAYIAAYHDQGLIPFKMIAGLSAVNVTIGLPFLRTSVSHGTAPDIVGQGVADPASLFAAYDTAIQLLKQQSLSPVRSHQQLEYSR